MALSNAVQALLAAFTFGILLNSAASTLFTFSSGHGLPIFKDGRRLVLVLFLTFAAMWGQMDFMNILIPSTGPTVCHVMVVASTMFDQLARVAIEQFLLWSVGHGGKATVEQLILQAFLGLRLVAGGIFVGFTRSEVAPVCSARGSVLSTSIAVVSFDAIIIGVLIIRAISSGMVRDLRDVRVTSRQEQSKAIILIIFGYLAWSGASIPMVLGMPSVALVLRTVLPATGLILLLGIMSLFHGALLLPREEETSTPEARSPFVTASVPSRDIVRFEMESGSPVSSSNGYTKNGNLFVVNPSAPRDSQTISQGSYKQDSREFTMLRGEKPAGGEQDLSVPKNAAGYRGSSGVFPSIIAGSALGFNQGVSAPIIRSIPPEASREVPKPTVSGGFLQHKMSLFGRSKPPPKSTVRSLGISKPVINDSDNPKTSIARMVTIDLATAAVNERERRESAAIRSRLIANRPAPNPPSAPQDGLRNTTSLKRKEIPSLTRPAVPAVPNSTALGAPINGLRANSTSTSLSPGREDVRRRSPRNVTGFVSDEKAILNSIPERQQSVGLPLNPRSRTTIAQDIVMPRQETVMFMNEIVYNNPGMVKTIVNGAPEMYASAKRAKEWERDPEKLAIVDDNTNPPSANSILHRPRPYRKDPKNDRQLFPSEPSPHHKRHKSGSSLVTPNYILNSSPRSPGNLPSLPRPPTSAANLTRLLPGSTKSMTVAEKIQLLFPAPPGSTLIQNRRSSVPSLPRVPSMFLQRDSPEQSPTEEEQQSRRTSRRTTIASFATQDLKIQGNEPDEEATAPAEIQTYRFPAADYRNIADEVGETWIPGIPASEVVLAASIQQDSDRASRALFDAQKFNFEELNRAQSTNAKKQDDGSRPRHPSQLQIGYGGGGEVMTVMLDSEENRRKILATSDARTRSLFLDVGEEMPGDITSSPKNEQPFHCRIGEDLPTFSERKTKTRSRKMPPPTPLLLNIKGRKAAVVIREPSPLDSPEKALLEIQAQLKRLDEPSRGSVGSLVRHIPEATPTATSVGRDDLGRLRLLETLELEMGQQENHWQEMHNNFDRDSISTTMTVMTPQPPVEADVSQESSQRGSRNLSQGVSRLARIRSSIGLRSKGEDSINTASTQSSDNTRASIWQQRLAEAQMEYMENAPALLQKRHLNFLPVSMAQLGSPTPPESDASETDLETDSESESESQIERVREVRAKRSLWEPSMAPPKAATGPLWNYPVKKPSPRATSPEPPAKNIRPIPRRNLDALQIFSFTLWSKPRSAPHSRPVIGLWGSKAVRPTSIVTRRVTQKPQRRSKRVTFLPDIVESPVPLPNKRDTLGIFQFPWGETSDSAIYEPTFKPTFRPAAISGPSLNARLEARSRQLEPDPAEYSSSFFDDYDEEQEDDEYLDSDDYDVDEEEDEYLESDDDFDESTLWEIASMLESKDVPSKNSLLPPPRELVDRYDNEENSDRESEQQPSEKAPRGPLVQLPIRPLATTNKPRSPLLLDSATSVLAIATEGLPEPKQSERDSAARAPVAMMWTPAKSVADVSVVGLFNKSTPRSDFRTSNLLPSATKMVNRPRATQANLSPLESTKLWDGNREPSEHHWISECSVRLGSPSVCSTTSSGRSSPSSDDSSVSSVSTVGSSLWGSIETTASVAPAWWQSKGSNDVHDANLTSRIPVPTKESPSLRVSRVRASRDLFESKIPVSKNDSVRKFGTSTVPQPQAEVVRKLSRYQHRAMAGSNWEEALAQAISASKPKQRPAVQPGMEDADLSEAIAKGRIHVQVYDPAVLHPVFFTESLESSVTDVHPAAIGRVRSRALSTRSNKKSLWDPCSINIASSPIFSNPHTEPWVRRKVDATGVGEIESRGLWRPSREIPESPRNWLLKRSVSKVIFRY